MAILTHRKQNNILLSVCVSWATFFHIWPSGRSLWAYVEVLGVAPQTRPSFSHCKKRPCGPPCKKASPLGTYKTYFEPGVLQLPTVGQIKRLYNSVQNRFYKQVQKGAFNGKTTIVKRHKIRHCFSSLLLFYIFVMVYLYV